MPRADLEYVGTLRGLGWPGKVVTSDPKGRWQIEAKADGAEVVIAVAVHDIAGPDEGERIADGLVRAFMERVSRISAGQIAYLSSPACRSIGFVDEKEPLGAMRSKKGVGLRLTAKATLVALLDRDLVEDGIRDLSRSTVPNSLQAELVQALAAIDPVVQYMRIHALLARAAGSPGRTLKQKSLDAFLIDRDPTIATSPHPSKRGVVETVYTRLRNEIAHPEDRGKSLAEIVPEVHTRLPDLRTLVANLL